MRFWRPAISRSNPGSPTFPLESGGGREKNDVEEIEKVLGVLWNRRTDLVSISMNIPTLSAPSLTKRTISGIMAGIYDVFDFGAPVIVTGKMKLQDL